MRFLRAVFFAVWLPVMLSLGLTAFLLILFVSGSARPYAGMTLNDILYTGLSGGSILGAVGGILLGCVSLLQEDDEDANRRRRWSLNAPSILRALAVLAGFSIIGFCGGAVSGFLQYAADFVHRPMTCLDWSTKRAIEEGLNRGCLGTMVTIGVVVILAAFFSIFVGGAKIVNFWQQRSKRKR